MLGNRVNLLIGFALYVIGVISSNVVSNFFFAGAPLLKFSFPIQIELAIICLGLMALSILYYAKFSFFVMFIIGLIFGGYLFTNPLLILLAVFPLGVAHSSGIEIGLAIKEDMLGRKNFWDEKWKIFFLVLIVLILSIATGYIVEAVKIQIPAKTYVVELPF
jgi:hypothetical protein